MKYEKQLFIFSDEVKNVKSYFSALYNNNNNKEHQIEKTINYEELAQKISVITKKAEHYELIKQLIKTDEALNVVVALLFKGFSWNNELLNEFNISSNLYVNKTLATLKKLDLLLIEEGISLHPILFDSLKNSKNGQLRKQLHQAKVFFITPKYIEFCKCLIELFDNKVLTSNNFIHSLENIVKHNEIFEAQYNIIMEQEKNQLSRKSLTDEGLIYETETLKAKELQKTIKEFKQELLEKEERKGTLTDNRASQLAEIRKGEVATLKSDKFNKEVKAEQQRQIAEVDRRLEEAKQQDEEIEKATLEVGKINLKGVKLDSHYSDVSYKLSKKEAQAHINDNKKVSEAENKDEGLKFLDSLGVEE